MALLRGIETTALGKTRTVEVSYENRAYVDSKGAVVKLQDMTCYSCLHSYFVLAADPIDFCPHCGRREGQPWTSHDDAVKWARMHDFKWLRKLGLEPFGLRRGDGVWILGFGRAMTAGGTATAMLGTGNYVEARSLLPGSS
jgi:hypothetical protein